MNQRSITEGLSRLVRIPALHAGGHGFKSHPLQINLRLTNHGYKFDTHGLVLIEKFYLFK